MVKISGAKIRNGGGGGLMKFPHRKSLRICLIRFSYRNSLRIHLMKSPYRKFLRICLIVFLSQIREILSPLRKCKFIKLDFLLTNILFLTKPIQRDFPKNKSFIKEVQLNFYQMGTFC